MSQIAPNEPLTLKAKINFWSVFWTVAWMSLIVLLALRLFVYQQVNVVGSSMEPNYHTDERLVVNRRNKEFSRGQVVAVYADKEIARTANYFTPYDPGTRFFLKRIIGLPGEEVEIVGSQVIIYNDDFPDGVILEENYVSDSVVQKQDEIDHSNYYPRTEIDAGEYFLLGDNRANSTDSRQPTVGNFPEYSIFGQETFRYWPATKASVFELPEYEFITPDAAFFVKQAKFQDAYQANLNRFNS